MTLIMGASSRWAAVMASDRLVTLADMRTGSFKGNHDVLANKTLILITQDEAVIIGFCGAAYLGGLPTDNWIANLCSPNAELISTEGSIGLMGLKRRSRLRLHQVCNRLRLGLKETKHGEMVTILIVGWRRRGSFLTPINIVLDASGLVADKKMRLRPDWPLRSRIQGIGAPLSERDYAKFSYLLPRDSNSVAMMLHNYFTETIRDKARTDPTIGSDITTMVIYHPSARKAACCFDPMEPRWGENVVADRESRQIVSYTPWILTPGGFQSPAESTGEPGSHSGFEIDGWSFECHSIGQGPGTPSGVGWWRPQDRTPRSKHVPTAGN